MASCAVVLDIGVPVEDVNVVPNCGDWLLLILFNVGVIPATEELLASVVDETTLLVKAVWLLGNVSVLDDIDKLVDGINVLPDVNVVMVVILNAVEE